MCFPFIGDKIGGSYIAALMLIDRLDGSRYEPIVVLHEEGEFAAELREREIRYRLLPLPAYVGAASDALAHIMAIARTVPILTRFLRRNGISLVHTNESPIAETWAVPARLSGTPLIWHEHGVSSASRLRSAMQALASRFVCISEFIFGQMTPASGPRCVTIANPFATERLAPDRPRTRRWAVAELGVSEPVMLFGFFGRLTRQKRPHVFLDCSASIFAQSGETARFLVFGDDRENLACGLADRVRELGLEGSVHFMGWRSDASAWMAACDIILAPAVDEGFGRVLVEAALAGVPVVAADAGGHPEIITHGETGLLVPPDDPTAMAEAALGLLRDRQRAAAIAEAAREAACRRFSADGHARRIEALYDDVMAERTRARRRPA